jgi:hypothetical protein
MLCLHAFAVTRLSALLLAGLMMMPGTNKMLARQWQLMYLGLGGHCKHIDLMLSARS